ncbi:putative esterase [Neolewinella xylanilytica]|uniref:Putative esterase n=1 Tax=Neolewinella xylanilytica TaxID=1514080 RepID=A0A2S6I9G8_9BACT|nr:alpha/beta hydrolase-fold protein [Neolewinella xylanilytica]PPK88146.1 putative esterase [Neolewinella xylanilytica]
MLARRALFLLFAGMLFSCVRAQTFPDPVTVNAHPLVETVTLESEALSAFWDRPVKLIFTVLLPSDYANAPNARYPVRYNVAGYAGRYDRVNRLLGDAEFADWWTSDAAPGVITVFLDGSGPFGDSYQLNSASSGPYGDALIEEIIPYVDEKYRTRGVAARYVDGCSTGGWVSLALQLFYPDSFAGTYSYSPDPVSFKRMQLIDMYADTNAFVNRAGLLRPSRRDIYGEPDLLIRDEFAEENAEGIDSTYVTGQGQWGAWNALYSPRGEDGRPLPAFDGVTGTIDPEVVEHWKQYDLLLHVQDNWAELGPKVAGKLYVWMGDMDNYYLNNAMRDFDAYLKTATAPASDAVIEFSPMKGHCTEYSHREVLERIGERSVTSTSAD